MTYVDTPTDSFLPDFFDVWPFNYLPAKLRDQIAPKLQPFAFHPGDVIYTPGELPLVIHCVVQGRVRILGPTSHQSPTLAVMGKGAVVGWDSLLRRVAVGSVRAAAATSSRKNQDVLTLALSADAFESIARQYLMSVLIQQASLIELFDTLSRGLAQMHTRFSMEKLKELVQYIEREQLVTVQHWFPPSDAASPTSSSPTSSLPPVTPSSPTLSPDYIWLLSGGAPLTIPIGTQVNGIEQLEPVRSSLFPVRLLGIDRHFWETTIHSGIMPRATVSAPLPATELQTPTMLQEATTASPPSSSVAPAASTYPIRRSLVPEPFEDLIACFDMICARLQIPYRPDTLRRWLKERSRNSAKESLDIDLFDLCTRVAQAIGFNAELVRFTPTAGGINRLSTPALINYRDVLVVLHDVTPTTAIIGSPRTGLLQIDPEELAFRLAPPFTSDNQVSTCRAVVLERLPQTPTKQFGFNWFLPVLESQRGILFQVLLASMFVQLLGVANPLLVQQIIDQVIINANLGAMTMFGVLMVLFAVLEGILTIVRMYLFASTTHRVDLRLGSEIVRHMLRLPLNFFEKRPVGELASRLSELENIRQFLTGTALTVVLDVVFSALYIVVMFLYSSQLTLCVLITVPVVILSTLGVSAIQEKLIRVKSDQNARVQSYLIETLGGIFTVKAQHMESLVEATWRERYVQYLVSGFRTATVNTMFSSFSSFLNTTSSLLVLWVGAGLVLEGSLTLGGLIAFRIMTGYVTGPLLRLAGLWQRFQETSLSMELLADIMNSPLEEFPQDEAHLQMPPIQGKVQYHDISFGFKAGQLQLSNVSVEIPSGAFVAVVGQSGSGKSTLLKLLPRLYLPQSGSISIDGYDINKVNLSSLRSQVGIVPQDAVLFEGTIRDNIALFGNLPDEVVMEAAKVAEAHDFIMQLPDGYRTQVGERGSSLSGGQRQRIAIARVVARNPRLLIFDEATSALDYETERRVCENLMRRLQGRTCFFITHRLNTITNADWILFMQTGVIAEQGTHQELMARQQLYYCLYTQQSQL